MVLCYLLNRAAMHAFCFIHNALFFKVKHAPLYYRITKGEALQKIIIKIILHLH